MAAKHQLGGRGFDPIGESTVEHDLHFLGLIRRAGLDDLKLEPGEVPAEFAMRILGSLLQSGSACDMLGCLLIPEGATSEAWTPQMAEETTRHIAGLTDPGDKQKVHALVVSVLIDFFESGLASWVNSESSLAQPALTPQSEPVGSPGARSSASSRGTTSTKLRRFFIGLFGRR